MADTNNLIAYLYPVRGNYQAVHNAILTIHMKENASRRVEARVEDPSRHFVDEPEESSSSCNDDDNNGDMEPEGIQANTDNENRPALRLRFDDLRKNRIGFVIGTSSSADIVLPKLQTLNSLASRQCALTFDEQRRLVVKDLCRNGRSSGTAVTYGGQDHQAQSQSTWIISGNRFSTDNQPIVLSLHDNLKFQIVVAQYDIDAAAYQENVSQFHQRVSADV